MDGRKGFGVMGRQDAGGMLCPFCDEPMEFTAFSEDHPMGTQWGSYFCENCYGMEMERNCLYPTRMLRLGPVPMSWELPWKMRKLISWIPEPADRPRRGRD